METIELTNEDQETLIRACLLAASRYDQLAKENNNMAHYIDAAKGYREMEYKLRNQFHN